MSKKRVRVALTVSFRDAVSVKLLVVALHLLHDQMRVEANARADDLGAILARFEARLSDGGEDDGGRSDED